MSLIKYLCLSDIHLGHNRNPTDNIVNNLYEYFDGFSDHSPFCHCDLIFIVGDLFDQLIDCSHHNLYDALGFITQLIDFCERFKIKLRVLEGTPSHDRQQNRLITIASEIRKTSANVKWINRLMIEHIEDLDLRVLYIPDEYTSSTDLTWSSVENLMKEQNLQQVDIAMMHGMFQYQMKNIPGHHDVHQEYRYLDIVKHFISIGHIHTHSCYERIIAQGSFDRLAHGEEEPKGGILLTIDQEDPSNNHWEFIENLNAKLFKTLEIEEENVDYVVSLLHREIKKLSNESHLRIKARKLHPVFTILNDIKKQYPFIHFSKLTYEEENEQKQSEELSITSTYNVVEIRPENVVDLILEETQSQTLLASQDQVKLKKLLDDLKNS